MGGNLEARLVGYPINGKEISFRLIGAFGRGAEKEGRLFSMEASGTVITDAHAIFYGVMPESFAVYQEVLRRAYRFYYIDHSYFFAARNQQYRISYCAEQCTGWARERPDKLEALGVKIQPWRKNGEHVLIAAQSDWWYERHGIPDWVAATKWILSQITRRPVRVRRKPRDPKKPEKPLADDLADCWAVVVHSSTVATEALIAGVPVIVAGASAYGPMTTNIQKIDDPYLPPHREDFLAMLAGNQWTEAEMESGEAWRAIHS